jgi:hypothetical protein
MGDTEVKVIISGEAAGVRASMAQAALAVRESVESMTASIKSVTGLFSTLSEGILAIGAVFAGGEMFKEIIDATKEWTEDSIQLGIALGIAASQASVYNIAIQSVGGTTGDLEGASRGLTRQLKQHEQGLRDMGLATRDSSGNLRSASDLMVEAIELVNSYTAGFDRNIAAQTVFGRGASSNSAVLRMTKEDLDAAAIAGTELGLIVGKDNVAAFEENRRASAGAQQTFLALKKAIGDDLLPVLTLMEQVFRDIGPIFIGLVKGGLNDLVTGFWGLIEVCRFVGAIATGIFRTMADTILGLGRVIVDLVNRDFSKLKDDMKGIGKNIQGDWKETWKTITADAADAKAKIAALWSSDAGGPTDAPSKGGKKMAQKPEKGPDNRLAEYKNELDLERQAADDFDHKDIAADLAFWQQKLAITTGGTKEDEKLRAEISKTILGLQRKQHDEEIKMEEEAIKTSESLALGEVDAKKQAIAQEFALGNITRQQEVQAEIALEGEKFRIQQAALEQRMQLAKFDLLTQQKLKDDELKLEQKHAADVQKIVNKEVLDEQKTWGNLFKTMESGFAQTIQSFLKGTTTLGGMIRGLFQNIASAVIQSLAQMAAKNIATMLEQAAAGKTIRAKEIMADAKAAAAGAYKAIVSIPYVGPFLAPAAAAVAFAGVMAFDSAEGGYDIPSNVNPLTQLHKNEMVLPAPLANVIRGMASSGGGDGGGSGGSGGDTYGDFHQTNHIHGGAQMTPDQMIGHLAKAIRNFHPAFR